MGDIVPLAGAASTNGAQQSSPGRRTRSVRKPGLPANRSVSTDRAEEPLLKNRFVSIGLLKNKLASFKRAAVIPGTKEG